MAYEQRLTDLLRLKYQGVHFDLIAVFAARALRVALEHRADLTPGVPIVFMAVDTPGDFDLPGDVTGVAMAIDSMETLQGALRLTGNPACGRGRGNVRDRPSLAGQGSDDLRRRARSARTHI